MNMNIEKGKKEYDEKNYKRALDYFDKVSCDDENYAYLVIFKINALMELEEYEKCLKFLNSLIGDDPYEEVFWYEKIRCHIFLDQDENALNALHEFERLIDKDDKYFVLSVAKFYDLLDDSQNALKYCNKAIGLDGNYEEAFMLKSQIAGSLDDNDMIVECAEKLIQLAEGNMIKLMLPFLLHLFVGNFRRSYEIISMMNGVDGEHQEMLKGVIYKQMCEDLNVSIGFSFPVNADIDEILNLLFKYRYDGVKSGTFKDADYIVV